jgi:8-oxo-dGTP pyrophosphatase MutT (NUDIX family)
MLPGVVETTFGMRCQPVERQTQSMHQKEDCHHRPIYLYQEWSVYQYVRDLRERVGSRPLILCGASVLILDQQDRLLLQHRVDDDTWGLPGGFMEIGESLEGTAAREMHEETGLSCQSLTFFNIYSGPELCYRGTDGSVIFNVTGAYLCHDYSGVPRVDGVEGKELDFFPLTDLPRAIQPPVQPITSDLCRRSGASEPSYSLHEPMPSIELPGKDYARSLRALVGTRPLILCAAGVLFVDDQGRILLQHRKDNDAWALPGGAMDLGETLDETARREAREEVGLHCKELALMGVYSGPSLYYRYPHGDEVYNVIAAYLCRSFSGEIDLDCQEVKDAKWHSLTQLPSSISPPDQFILDDCLTAVVDM